MIDLRSPPAVDPRHDALRNRDRIRNGRFQERRRSSVPVRQLPGGKDACGDQEHALATLIHIEQRSIFAFRSLYWVPRLLQMETSTHSMPNAVQNVGSMKQQSARRPKLDEIGEWSELKLDILKKYAGAYCTILKARGLRPIYIDGFAGAGVHIRKGTGSLCRAVR